MSYDRAVVTTASNAEADSLCAGRFQANRGLPDVVSPDAQHGRVIHEALKRQNPEGLNAEQRDIYESIQKIEINLLTQVFGLDAPNAIKHCYREVALLVQIGEYAHGATPDVVYRWLGKGLILEYKTLAGEIPAAPSNKQMRDQVVCVAQHYAGLQEVYCAVVQPLVTHKPFPCCYSGPDIASAYVELGARLGQCHSKHPQRTPGQVQCAFCKAKLLCQEYNHWISSQLPVPANLSDLPVALWKPEQRKVFCDHKAAAAKWLKDTTEAMKKGVKEDPNFIPGWTLDDGDERRSVTDMEVLHERFLKHGGTTKQFLSCMKLTLGDFEEAVSACTKLNGKKLKDKVSELLAGIVETKRSEPSLIRRKE